MIPPLASAGGGSRVDFSNESAASSGDQSTDATKYFNFSGPVINKSNTALIILVASISVAVMYYLNKRKR